MWRLRRADAVTLEQAGFSVWCQVTIEGRRCVLLILLGLVADSRAVRAGNKAYVKGPNAGGPGQAGRTS